MGNIKKDNLVHWEIEWKFMKGRSKDYLLISSLFKYCYCCHPHRKDDKARKLFLGASLAFACDFVGFFFFFFMNLWSPFRRWFSIQNNQLVYQKKFKVCQMTACTLTTIKYACVWLPTQISPHVFLTECCSLTLVVDDTLLETLEHSYIQIIILYYNIAGEK